MYLLFYKIEEQYYNFFNRIRVALICEKSLYSANYIAALQPQTII